MAAIRTPQQAVEMVLLVPDEHREFDQSTDRTRRYHGIGEPLLTELIDLGLPYRGKGDGRVFDRLDLENIGLALGLSCPRRSAMRWWSRSFVTAPWARFEVDLPTGTGWTTHHRDVTAVRVTDAGQTASIRLNASEFLFGPPYADLLEYMRDAEFHLLPRSLSSDLGFFRETRLANCGLSALYLSETAHESGLHARAAHGFLVAAPFSIEHAWINLQVDGNWIAADPLLLQACAKWGVCDPVRWPLNRSPRGFLWQVDETLGNLSSPLMTRRSTEAV